MLDEFAIAEGVPYVASDHQLKAMLLSALLGKTGSSMDNGGSEVVP
ncbi:MAG: hypothetical protein ABIH26_15425 [Candidatus Eisenbacteria bacterium]